MIGTNKKDATETVELLLEDAARGPARAATGRDAETVDALLAERGVEFVDVRRLGGDRRARSARAASRTAARG